jgi:hypothetical protein
VTPEELAAGRAAPAMEDPALEPVRNAVAAVAAVHDGVAFVADAGRGCTGASDAAAGRGIWVAGEITASGSRDAGWQSGATIDVTVSDAAGHAIGRQQATLSPPARAVVVTMGLAGAQEENSVGLVARSAVASVPPVKETLRLAAGSPAGDAPTCVGSAMLLRRSPFTGNTFQPTTDPRFRRQERVRVEAPVSGRVESFTATLLDRAGKAIPVPMMPSDRKDASGWRWIGGDLALAPLAAGEYVVQIEVVSGATRQKVLRAFRIIP